MDDSSEYRLLTDGDTIQADDEWLQEDAQTWVKSPGWIIGMEYRRGRALRPARRELRPNTGVKRCRPDTAPERSDNDAASA